MGSHYSKPNLVKTCFPVARGGAVHKQFHFGGGIGNFLQFQSRGTNFCYSSETIMMFIISFCGKQEGDGFSARVYAIIENVDVLIT